MFQSFKKHVTARGVIWSLLTAVLFFFSTSVSSAQGLRIDLKRKSNIYSYHKPVSNKVRLSLAFSELPLLQNKIIFSRSIKIDYEENVVELKDKLGSYPVTRSFPLRLDSYKNYNLNYQLVENWNNSLSLSLSRIQRGETSSLFEFVIPIKFPSIVSRFIGEGGPSLKITGNRRISFSGKSNWVEGAVRTAAYKPSKWPSLKMEQKYDFRIDGSIGSKIFVDVVQNSESQTDLENRIHLKYVGEEDEILQSIEAGNTNLRVGNSLVGYSQAIRGLFGIKAQARLGRLNLTMITSQEKSATERTEFKAGSESLKSAIRDYEYYARRFYYLGRDSVLGYDTNDFQTGDVIIDFELYR
ncbi:MAG: hypothetical protein OEV55_09265, partial [candidate division Zixibacteria bacterium]|nr:hypothetical protein [candidate division Zixibacteria bacterium]